MNLTILLILIVGFLNSVYVLSFVSLDKYMAFKTTKMLQTVFRRRSKDILSHMKL